MKSINFGFIDNNEKYQTIFINGSIDNQIYDLYKGKDGVIFKINSDGGTSTTSQNLIERLIKYKGKKIMLSYGNVRSAAFSIFMFGDIRYGSKWDNFLIHGGSISGSNSIPIKTTRFLTDITQDFFILQAKRLAKISNQPFNFWLDLFTNGSDNYFTGKDMKKFGIIKYY